MILLSKSQFAIQILATSSHNTLSRGLLENDRLDEDWYIVAALHATEPWIIATILGFVPLVAQL